MVTPPYKDGFSTGPTAVSEDGTQMMVQSFGVFGHPTDTGEFAGVYDISRQSLGWTPTPMDAPPSTFTAFGAGPVTTDFGRSLWTATPPAPPSQQPIASLYLAEGPHGPFVLVGPDGPPTLGGLGVLHLVGASGDLAHSVYEVDVANPGEPSRLWPGDGTLGVGESSLYEYGRTGNEEPRLVGVSDEHQVMLIGESHLISQCGTSLGSPSPTSNTENAISEDGDTVFFTALGRDYRECGTLAGGVVEPSVNELYARVNASRTVAISEPDEADCGECTLAGPADAEFQGASLDGSKVFFTTTQHLLAGAEGAGSDLYEYDFDGPAGDRVKLVSAGDHTGAQVEKVLRVSRDGSHVYFLAQGVLTTTANSLGQQAEANAHNLYVYERDSAFPAGHVTFIARGGAGRAQTTPDGRYLVFESTADLTPDQEGSEEAGQVFEYDAQTGALVRVSRGQNGHNDDGNTNVYPARIPNQEYSPDVPTDALLHLAMSNDGAYVFFTSEDGLTPQALTGANNVYEYHEGKVSLISDGHDLTRIIGEPAVNLAGTDGSGRDVFFTTADGLLAQDTDTQVDIYDARTEGGFSTPAAARGCLDDACQGPLASGSQQPTPPTSASPGETPPPLLSAPAKSTPKALTRAQTLSKALKACQKKKKKKRAACEKQAKKRYGRSK